MQLYKTTLLPPNTSLHDVLPHIHRSSPGSRLWHAKLSKLLLHDFKGLETPVQFNTNITYEMCKLTSLIGGPLYQMNADQYATFNRGYDVGDNNLITLKGAPLICSCFFVRANPDLHTLEGGPLFVSHRYSCHSLPSLRDLRGSPLYVGDNFYCQFNNLTSFKGAPRVILGNFYCDAKINGEHRSSMTIRNMLEDQGTFVRGDIETHRLY